MKHKDLLIVIYKRKGEGADKLTSLIRAPLGKFIVAPLSKTDRAPISPA